MTRRESWTPETSGFDSFVMGMEASAARPQGKDPVIQAIGMACVEEVSQPYFRTLIEAGMDCRKPILPSHAAGVGRIALIQKRILFPDARHPYEMTNDKDPFAPFHWRGSPRPKAVKKFLRQLYDPDSSGDAEVVQQSRDEAVDDMNARYMGTTDENRYVLPMVAAAIIHRQIPGYFDIKEGEGLDIVDFGCGNNYGLKWLGLKHKLTIQGPQPPKIRERVSPKHLRGSTKFAVDPVLTEAINLLWHAAPRLGMGLGIDIMDSYDRDIIRWRNSCRYPQEYRIDNPNYTKVEQNEFMELTTLPNVLFREDDITDIDMDKISPSLGEYRDEVPRFHVAKGSTVFYEMTPEQQLAAINNMRRMARLGVLQDFGVVDPRDRRLLKITDKSLGTPNTYTTAVGDLSEVDPRFYAWFIGSSGRVENAQLGPDFGLFNGEQIFTEEDLRRLIASPRRGQQGRHIFA